MDDAYDVGANLVNNFDYSPPSGPIVLGTPADSGGFFNSALNLFGAATTTYTNLQNGLFNQQVRQANLDIAKQNLAATQYVAGTNLAIEKLRGDYALTSAQQQLATAKLYGVGASNGIAGFLSTGPLSNKSDTLMVLLTIAGVAFAWAEYAKS